jgi:hypothetical protein
LVGGFDVGEVEGELDVEQALSIATLPFRASSLEPRCFQGDLANAA